MRPISTENSPLAALAVLALSLAPAARAAPPLDEPFPPHHVFVAGAFSNNVIEFDEDGEFVRELAPPGLISPRSVAFGPDGLLYVLSLDNVVFALDGGGSVARTLSPIGIGQPNEIVFGPQGHLIVATDSNVIQEYDVAGPTPKFVRHFDTDKDARGLAIGANGHYYVGGDIVYEYTPDGAFVRTLTNKIEFASKLCVGPRGHLWVRASNDRLCRFDAVGKHLGDFDAGGELFLPEGSAFGPNGMLYVTSGGSDDKVVVVDPDTDTLLDELRAPPGVLNGPFSVAFSPERFVAKISGQVSDALRDATKIKEKCILSVSPGLLLIELQDEPGDPGDLASTFGQAAVVLRTFERRPAGVDELVAYGSGRHFPSETAGTATAALRLLGDLEDGRLEIEKVRGTFARGSEAGSFSGKLKTKKKLD